MSIKFEGGATSTLRDEFRERKEYKEYEGFQRFRTIDTHYEKFKYGMMNRQFEPVTLISEQTDETLQNFPELADNVMVLPFVAIAFNEFREEYTNFINNSSSPTVGYPKFIEAVVPRRGYLNFSDQFARYINYNIEINRKTFATEPEVKDFDTFIDRFFEIFNEIGQEFPVTKSGYTTSKHCSIMTSGLCIELAEKNYDLDEPKGEMIVSSAFECFADYANAYGFLIDKYVPWRIVADVNSTKMREYMVKGRSIDVSRALDFFESTYTVRSCYDDLYLLRNYLFSIYYPLHRATHGPDATLPALEIVKLVQILFRVRMIELGVPHENFSDMNQKVVDIYNKYGLRYVSGYIGQITSEKMKETYEPR